MKKRSIVSVLLVCLFLCSCSPLKKSIVSKDNYEAIGDEANNNNSNIISREIEGKLRDGDSNINEPDIVKKDDSSENAGEKSKATPQTEEPNSTLSPKAVKPQAAKSVPSQPVYVVRVDISDQKVYIYMNGTEIRTMTCSTGVKGHETPEGEFKIRGRGDWFFSEEFQQGGKYWVGFIGGTYLFHSVPTDRKKRIIPDESSKLGMPASHGCVRLSEDDAKWFFNTIPDGSVVDIQK